MLWDVVYPDRAPDGALADGERVRAPAASSSSRCTRPGTPPAALPPRRRERRACSRGDTLFKGGPGATGRSFSDFATIIESIRTRLLTLPPDTVVHTGHGDDTRIGDEAAALDE